MSRRRALSELLQKLLMASYKYTGAPVGGARSRYPSALRAAASNSLATRALEPSPSCWPPSPLSALPLARRRPRFPLDRAHMHAALFFTSSSILSRSSRSHRAHRSFSAAATSVDAADASSSTDANDDDDGGDKALDSFLAPPSVTFASLGLDSQVCDALRAAGIAHPSAVQVRESCFFSQSHSFFFFRSPQNSLSTSSSFPLSLNFLFKASAIPPLLSSSDAVLAAQTGSGKTLAYLAPLISRLRSAQALPRVDDDGDDDDEDAELDFDDSGGSRGAPSAPALVLPSPGDPPPPSLGLLVLCPNAALCDQVVSVCNDVFSRGGLALSAARVGGGGGGGGSDGTLLFPPREERFSRRLFKGAQHGRARRDVRSLRPGQEGQGLLHPGACRGGRRGVATGRRGSWRRRGRRLRATVLFRALLCVFQL